MLLCIVYCERKNLKTTGHGCLNLYFNFSIHAFYSHFILFGSVVFLR